MRPRKHLVFVAIVAATAAEGVGQAVEPDVTVRTSIDRTAIWVADRLTYTIELTCRRGIDVVADDLSRDKLKTEGLDIIGSETDSRSAPDVRTAARQGTRSSSQFVECCPAGR